MYVRCFVDEDETDFLEFCKEFYSSGATVNGFNEEIAKTTFMRVLHQHENLWGYFMIDKDSGEKVGYSLLTSYWCNEEGGNVIILDEIYIRPSSRKHGYGTQFMEWVETEFRHDAVSVSLEVLTSNAVAKQLYAKQGYLEDGFQILSKKI